VAKLDSWACCECLLMVFLAINATILPQVLEKLLDAWNGYGNDNKVCKAVLPASNPHLTRCKRTTRAAECHLQTHIHEKNLSQCMVPDRLGEDDAYRKWYTCNFQGRGMPNLTTKHVWRIGKLSHLLSDDHTVHIAQTCALPFVRSSDAPSSRSCSSLSNDNPALSAARRP